MSETKVRRFATRTVHGFELVSENDKRERVTEKVDIVYRSYSRKLITEIESAETTEENKVVPFSAYLAHEIARIIVLPKNDGEEEEDLTGDDGNPVVFYDGTTPETLAKARDYFDGLSQDITVAMQQAIEDDINPQTPSPEAGHGG